MKTIHYGQYTTHNESPDSMREAHRWNPATELTYKDKTVTLGCGTRDDLNVFEEAGLLFVTATNYGLSYIGIQVFNGEEQVHEGMICDDQAIPFLNLTPMGAVKRLSHWFAY